MAVLGLLLSLVAAPAVRAAQPEITPIPDQIVNGGHATTPGLAENTTRFPVEWTDADAGQTYDTQVIWGDGAVDTYPLATSPYLVEHEYPGPGEYFASVQVTDSGGAYRVVSTHIAVADLSSGAQTKLYSPRLSDADFFGEAVVLDGSEALVAEPYALSDRGRVYDYSSPGGGARAARAKRERAAHHRRGPRTADA